MAYDAERILRIFELEGIAEVFEENYENGMQIPFSNFIQLVDKKVSINGSSISIILMDMTSFDKHVFTEQNIVSAEQAMQACDKLQERIERFLTDLSKDSYKRMLVCKKVFK